MPDKVIGASWHRYAQGLVELTRGIVQANLVLVGALKGLQGSEIGVKGRESAPFYVLLKGANPLWTFLRGDYYIINVTVGLDVRSSS